MNLRDGFRFQINACATTLDHTNDVVNFQIVYVRLQVKRESFWGTSFSPKFIFMW